MSEKKPQASRRRLIRNIAAGGGVFTAGSSLPKSWTRPVVESIVLPAHAVTTQFPPSGNSPPPPASPPGCGYAIAVSVKDLTTALNVPSGSTLPFTTVQGTVTVTPNPGAGQTVQWTRTCSGGLSGTFNLTTDTAGMVTTPAVTGQCVGPPAEVETWTFTFSCAQGSWSVTIQPIP